VDVTAALEQTFTHTSGVLAGVQADQLDDPTPCREWTVRQLLEHMIGVVAGLGSAAAGKPPAEFVLGADPAAQFDEAATAALAAWRTPGVLDGIVDIPAGSMPGHVVAGINLLDTATHTWDLATATGQPAELPEPVATAALEASEQIVSPEIRTGRFGPEQPVPAGASTTARLVAFLGRTP
jgi:uncharacterized protein (TIGR03086 family)